MTLSAKSSLILGENKATFRREGHIFFVMRMQKICYSVNIKGKIIKQKIFFLQMVGTTQSVVTVVRFPRFVTGSVPALFPNRLMTFT